MLQKSQKIRDTDLRKRRMFVAKNRRIKPYVYSYEVKEASELLGISEHALRLLIAQEQDDNAQ